MKLRKECLQLSFVHITVLVYNIIYGVENKGKAEIGKNVARVYLKKNQKSEKQKSLILR